MDDYAISYGVNTTENQRAGSSPVILFVNGDAISDAKAVIQNGTTLVPLRVISTKLNADVTWNTSTKTAEITYGSTFIQATVGNSYITVNGSNISISAPTQIINFTAYVPLRAIASAFGAEVGFDGGCFEGVKVVWVQNTSQSPSVTASGAVDIAEDVFFDKFLPTMRSYFLNNYGLDTNNLTPDNFYSVMHSKFPWWTSDFLGEYTADLGQYYYIKYFDLSNQGLLADKYDGSFYPVSSYSITVLNIGGKNTYEAWGLLFN
ncbi:MAG: copper amine oxidase N-terminal domain-containing protein [Clostridiales bacterium]|nr:copper amine oxidase N-terminal domain-containing protein [Clostridiales bacterium]